MLTCLLPVCSHLARRISAISIAERVAQEQCLSTDSLGTLIGYQVRLEAAASKDTQLLFVTPGILLRRLQSSPQLEEFTHIVIDEVHERDKYTEFLLITLRDLLPKRPDLRLILMSATLQTELLINYFASYDHDFYRQYPPAVLEIEGRTFPVQEFFLEHVLELTGYIDPAVAAAAAAATSSSNTGGEMPILSMEELDAELAKLLNDGTNNNYETTIGMGIHDGDDDEKDESVVVERQTIDEPIPKSLSYETR